MDRTQINRVSVADQVATLLRQRILEGEFRPGTQLQELTSGFFARRIPQHHARSDPDPVTGRPVAAKSASGRGGFAAVAARREGNLPIAPDAGVAGRAGRAPA